MHELQTTCAPIFRLHFLKFLPVLFLLAACTAPVSNAPVPLVSISDDLPVDAAHFPDPLFRAYAAENFDTDNDGVLQPAEREAVAQITFTEVLFGKAVHSLQGVQYFPNLAHLNCLGNKLESLDVSQNPVLEVLMLNGNNLTVLDVSQNPALRILACYGNNLNKLDVSQNPALTLIWCGKNPFTTLDVSANPVLKSLSCTESNLTTLDVSQNPALERLDVDPEVAVTGRTE